MHCSVVFSGQTTRCVFRTCRSLNIISERRLFATARETCPFSVLGIPKASSYTKVKQEFVKLALQHHPDTRQHYSEEQEREFFEIRQAFESIGEDHNGMGVLVASQKHNSSSGSWTDESLSAWFEQQTGRSLSFAMDESTRQEVVQVAETMSPGGLDRGGMWEMANMVARQNKNIVEPVKYIPEGQSKRRKKR